MIDKKFKQILENNGRSFSSSNNTPFVIDDNQSVWYVQEGNVDVFFVKVEDNKPTGIRRYLFRVKTGQLLFGIPSAQYGGEFTLLAVGTPGTKVILISFEKLRKVINNDEYKYHVASLVDQWVNHISEALTRRIFPRPIMDILVDKTESVDIPTNMNVTAKKKTVWVKNLSQSDLFVGLEFIFYEQSNYFPLSSHAWIQSGEHEVLSVHDSKDVIQTEEFWRGLGLFHQLFFESHSSNIRLENVDEMLKIKGSREHRKNILHTSLLKLAKTVDDKKSSKYDWVEHPSQDALVNACQCVARASGFDLAIPADFRSDKYKTPLITLLHLARVKYRKVTLSDEWWREDNGPLLAFTEKENNPVALIPASPGRYYMIQHGQKTVPLTDQVADSLRDAFILYRPFGNQNIGFKEFCKFGMTGTGADIKSILFLGIGGALLGMLTPIFTGIIFDTVIPEAAKGELFQMVLALIITGLVIGIFLLTRSVALLRIESHADINLQAALMDRVLKLPIRFFRGFTSGDIATRANGINVLRQLLGGATASSIVTSIFVFLNFGLLIYYNKKLAWWTFLLVLFAFVFNLLFTWFQLKYQRKIQDWVLSIQGTVYQFLIGISKLRSTGGEEGAFNLWAQKFKNLRMAQFHSKNLQIYVYVFYYIFPLLAAGVIYYKVSKLMLEQPMEISDFIAFIAAFATITAAMSSFPTISQQFIQAVPVYENIKPILATRPEVDEQKTIVEELRGDIEINHVSYRYNEDTPLVLRNIYIHVHPGEFIAIVGPSGAGKSTIFRLLLGFEQPLSGTIYFDGHDISNLDITALRRQLGTVMQNSRLMTGPIFKNIIGTSPDLTMDDAWEAARLVGIEDDIKKMPMGMHTVVSEGGSTLSGGQRQRLLLARAIVKKSSILLLDEATSALDNQTQELVSKSLDEIKMTRIVVAHRLSTIMNADVIYVLKDGVIAEKGKYTELLAMDGVFTELAKRQLI